MELIKMIKTMRRYENGRDIEYSDDNFGTVPGKTNREDDEELC